LAYTDCNRARGSKHPLYGRSLHNQQNVPFNVPYITHNSVASLSVMWHPWYEQFCHRWCEHKKIRHQHCPLVVRYPIDATAADVYITSNYAPSALRADKKLLKLLPN